MPSHGRGHWFDPSTAHHKINELQKASRLFFPPYGMGTETMP